MERKIPILAIITSRAIQRPGFILIGCGTIAHRHLVEILFFGQLVAICDTDEHKVDELRKKYKVPGFTSFNELLLARPGADIMVLCTPNAFHAEQSIRALEHGYHVICEKPMALKSIDALRMIHTSQATHRHLLVIKQNRFNKPLIKLKEWVSTGQSGKLFSFSLNCLWNRNDAYYQQSAWHGSLELDGGILYTQFSHYFDFLVWLFGEVALVHTMTANANHTGTIEFDDQAVAILQFESGLMGTVHCSINSHKKNMESSLTVLAEHGSVKIGGPACDQVDYENTTGFSFDEGLTDTTTALHTGTVSNHHLVYKQFLDQVLLDIYDTKSLHEAMKTIELIERIYAASALPTLVH